MDVSVYLIKLFGSYFFLLALFFTVAYKRMVEAVNSIVKDESLVRALGIINVFSGLALLLAYFNEYNDYRIILQIIAVLMLISGVMRVLFYSGLKSFVTKHITKKRKYYFIAFLYLVSLALFYSIS